MNSLAFTYYNLGRLADARKLYEEALVLMKGELGPDHSDTLRTMDLLAFTHYRLGRQADALKLREQRLALIKAKFGPDHLDTLRSTYTLANFYAALGKHVEALKLREELLAWRKAKCGSDHFSTLMSMWDVADSLIRLDRGAEALPLIDELMKRAEGKVVHPQLIPRAMDIRLRHFAKIKDAAGCRATAEMWEKLKRTDAASLYDAACMRAVTAAVTRASDKSERATKNANADADRAMAWLRKAVAAGFKNVDHLKKDKDLDSLRDREDFKKLLADLQPGKGKEKKERERQRR
jgi:tetratricopeptide (TPR) repeat protein